MPQRYVTVEGLRPGADLGEHSKSGAMGAMAGSLVMMLLDVALGRQLVDGLLSPPVGRAWAENGRLL